MREKFQKQLDQIRQDWYDVALEVLGHCRTAGDSLSEPNKEEIEELMERDSEVLEKTRSIQKRCLELLALQQPMAVDLRQISSYLRSSDDIERINRSSIHIAEVAKARLYDRSIPEFCKILELCGKVVDQLQSAIEAFNFRDVEKAEMVMRRDSEIDGMHAEIFGSLLERVRRDDARASLLMFVSRWMERIGDRSVGLASKAIYIVEGRDVELEAEIGEFKVFPSNDSAKEEGQ
jgi:phosphate transport system protein